MINHLNYSKSWSNIIIFTIIMIFNVVQCKCCDLVTQTRNCPPKSSCLGKCPVLLQSIVNIITVHIQYKAMKKIILKSFSRTNLSTTVLHQNLQKNHLNLKKNIHFPYFSSFCFTKLLQMIFLPEPGQKQLWRVYLQVQT